MDVGEAMSAPRGALCHYCEADSAGKLVLQKKKHPSSIPESDGGDRHGHSRTAFSPLCPDNLNKADLREHCTNIRE